MKSLFALTVFCACLIAVSGCSRQSAEKTRYDMEKMAYAAGRLSEKINVQPDMATKADTTNLLSAFEDIVKFYTDHRGDPNVQNDHKSAAEMAHMAVSAEVARARIFTAQKNPDSVLAAYRRIGSDIPADREELAASTMALAMVYRALNQFDSTLTIYDRLLASYYPPIDSLKRVNIDIVAIPIDKIKILQSLPGKVGIERALSDAVAYYEKLKRSFADNPFIVRAARTDLGRIYSMTDKWDSAIEELSQVTDSSGRLDTQAQVIIANIYEGPKKDPTRAAALFKEIIERKPDSATLGSSLLHLGVILCSQKQYDDGRRYLTDLKEKFSRHQQLAAPAQLYFALSFEQDGHWDRALSELQWLLENYPYTEEAFKAALYIPQHFAREKDQKMTDLWYQRAEEFFQAAIKNKQGQSASMAAYLFLANTYRDMKKYEEALTTLDKMYSLAPKSRIGANALYNAAGLALFAMKDSVRAQGYLDRLNKEFGPIDTAAFRRAGKTDLNLESIQ